MTRRVAFLGPCGSFSHEAAAFFTNCGPGELLPCMTLVGAIDALADKDVCAAVVPIVNSTEGVVTPVIDRIIHHCQKGRVLQIIGEFLMPITQALLTVSGATLSDIQEVRSHAQALAQCQQSLRSHGKWIVVETTSTAKAAKEVYASGSKSLAAIASRFAADWYGLQVLASPFNDEANNTTRFFLLGEDLMAPTGCDRTSLCFTTLDVPGALCRALTVFDEAGINLTTIQSRPTKQRLDEVIFWVTAVGHFKDEPLAKALSELQSHVREFWFLGSYPAAVDFQAANRVAAAS